MTVKAHPCVAGINPIVEKKVKAPQPGKLDDPRGSNEGK